MSAEKKNLINRGRHRLEEVLPLETPYCLFIDPCSLCNFKCRFCAMQASEEPLPFKKQLMPMELYKKIIDDISGFPDKLKMLRLAAHGEPLLHPQLPEMIRYAKEKGVTEFVEIVTNGSLLKPELNQALVESGLDCIRISIEALDAEGYRENTGARVEFDELLAKIGYFNRRSDIAGNSCEVYVKTVDATANTKEREAAFYSLFENISHKMWIDHIIPIWAGWDDLSNRFELQQIGVHGQALREIKVCPFPLYSLVITPDGIATVCCSDWKRKLVIGDLNRQSLKEVWDGDVLKKFWIDMLSGNRARYEMCAACTYPTYNSTDNIDAYAEDILKRMECAQAVRP